MNHNPKLIKQWKDDTYGSTNYAYKYEDGPYLLFIDNPGTIDFDITVIFKAGAFFESQLQVPRGTAHMLEHLMVAPHGRFPTIEAEHKFTFGNENRPALGTNAYTSDELVGFTASTNEQGWERAVEFMIHDIDFAHNDLSANLESERNIILAELAHEKPEDKDPTLLWNRMVTEDKYPSYFESVLGSTETVKSITKEILTEYYHQAFHAEDCVILIQTKLPQHEITAGIQQLVEAISHIRGRSQLQFEQMPVVQNYYHMHYDSPTIKENYFEIAYMQPRPLHIDYALAATKYFARTALRYCGNLLLREKKNLVYNFDLGSHYLTPITEYLSLGCKMEAYNLLPVMDGLYDLVQTDGLAFLESKEHIDWWQSVLSSYIFKRTAEFDYKFGRNYAYAILMGEEYGWDEQKSAAAAKALSVDQVKQYIRDTFAVPPILYTSSNTVADEAVIEAYHQSKWAAKFGMPKLFVPKDLIKNATTTKA